PPRSSTPHVAARSQSTTVTPVRPTGSVACPTRTPGTSVIIVAGTASPARSVGGLRRGAIRLRPASRFSLHGVNFSADVRGAEPARRDFRRQLQRPLSEGARERVAARVHVGIAERRRGRARERAEVGTPGRVEDERHLGQPPRPATPRLGAELALDDAADPRGLLRGTQGGKLSLEPPLGDPAACDLEDTGGVVDDQRAERGAAEAALEEDPERARAAAVDARDPRARGALGRALDDRAR